MQIGHWSQIAVFILVTRTEHYWTLKLNRDRATLMHARSRSRRFGNGSRKFIYWTTMMMIITFSAGLDSDWSRRRPGISFRSCSSGWRNESTWTVPDARRNLLMRFKCDVLWGSRWWVQISCHLLVCGRCCWTLCSDEANE